MKSLIITSLLTLIYCSYKPKLNKVVLLGDGNMHTHCDGKMEIFLLEKDGKILDNDFNHMMIDTINNFTDQSFELLQIMETLKNDTFVTPCLSSICESQILYSSKNYVSLKIDKIFNLPVPKDATIEGEAVYITIDMMTENNVFFYDLFDETKLDSLGKFLQDFCKTNRLHEIPKMYIEEDATEYDTDLIFYSDVLLPEFAFKTDGVLLFLKIIDKNKDIYSMSESEIGASVLPVVIPVSDLKFYYKNKNLLNKIKE